MTTGAHDLGNRMSELAPRSNHARATLLYQADFWARLACECPLDSVGASEFGRTASRFRSLADAERRKS